MRSVSAAEALQHYGAAFLHSIEDNESNAHAAAQTSRKEALSNLDRQIDVQEPASTDDSSEEGRSSQDANVRSEIPVYEFRNSTVARQGDRRPKSRSDESNPSGRSCKGPKGADEASMPISADKMTWSGSKAELAALQRQVQSYGAGALDKKSRKQYDVQQLARLGLKAPKAQKMAAAVGKGLKQVHLKREHKAIEAAIEAGHLSRTSVSKQQKKQRQTARRPEDSLREDNGAFVGGVMHIRKAAGNSGFLGQKRKSRK